MKRAILGVLALLAVGAIGAGAWLWYSLDHVAQRAIEHFGSEALGVEVKVDRVRLSPADGRGEIDGLRVANPRGFRRPTAASAARIELEVDPATLASDVIVIRRLEVTAPAIVYETAAAGSNLDALKRTAARGAKAAASPTSAGKPPPGKKLIVDRLVIRRGTLGYAPAAISTSAEVQLALPDIVLTNVGRKRGGVTPEELASIIVDAITARTVQTLGPARVKDGVRGLLGF